MAILFGSPEALKILESNKKFESALEKRGGQMITIAALEKSGSSNARDLIAAREDVDRCRRELEDAESELWDIEKKLKKLVPENGANLDSIDEDDWDIWCQLTLDAKEAFKKQIKK
jgi:t-SNARE complex subunit (syntaxin)